MQYLVYNTDNGGYFGQALKNLRVGKRNREKKNAMNPITLTSPHDHSIEVGTSSDICSTVPENMNVGDLVSVEKSVFEQLKSTIVNDQNMSLVKNMMKSTLNYRLNLMQIVETDVLESFPYLFTHPELVTYK